MTRSPLHILSLPSAAGRILRFSTLFRFSALKSGLIIAVGCSMLAGCGSGTEEDEAKRSPAKQAPGGVAKDPPIQIGAGGVLQGETEPFTGKKMSYYKSGEIAISYTFEAGILQIREEWLKNGTKKRETRYRDGEANFQTVWRADGGKKIETGLKDGKPHGSHKRWHANGKLGWVGEFYEGKFHGLVEDRDENGVLLLKGRYDKGELLEDLLGKE